MNWRLYIRRYPRALLLPFMSLVFLGLLSSLLRDANVRPVLHVPRYFYQQSYLQYTNESTSYDLVVVADKDKASKNGNAWESTLLNGVLTRDTFDRYSITWEDSVCYYFREYSYPTLILSKITLKSKINEDGRGMELSDLAYFNGKLYTFDDRTGIVFQVDRANGLVVPQVKFCTHFGLR